MTARQRWTIIGGLLLCTLGAALWVAPADEAAAPAAPAAPARRVAQPAASTPRQTSADAAAPAAGEAAVGAAPAASASSTATDASGLARNDTSASGSATDPFRVKSWLRPPPPPPPAEPVAPPLPFQYLGKLSEGEQTRVFLKHEDRYLVAQAGDVLNGSYAVEEIAGGRITFVYRPLNEKQQLAIGSDK